MMSHYFNCDLLSTETLHFFPNSYDADTFYMTKVKAINLNSCPLIVKMFSNVFGPRFYNSEARPLTS